MSDILIGGGTVTVDVAGDGLHADVALAIAGGSVTVAGSDEGLESALVQIDGGVVDVTATDDAINGSAGSSTTASQSGMGGGMADSGELVTVTGGEVTLHSGGDGLDSNGSIDISGGTVIVWGPASDGNAALDANGGLSVTGGTLLAVGSAGMAESPDAASTQAWLQAQASGAAGSTIVIQDADGATIASFEAESAFSNVVFSGSGLSGERATVVIDGAATAVALGTATGGMGGGAAGGGTGSGGPGGRHAAEPAIERRRLSGRRLPEVTRLGLQTHQARTVLRQCREATCASRWPPCTLQASAPSSTTSVGRR